MSTDFNELISYFNIAPEEQIQLLNNINTGSNKITLRYLDKLSMSEQYRREYLVQIRRYGKRYFDPFRRTQKFVYTRDQITLNTCS